MASDGICDRVRKASCYSDRRWTRKQEIRTATHSASSIVDDEGPAIGCLFLFFGVKIQAVPIRKHRLQGGWSARVSREVSGILTHRPCQAMAFVRVQRTRRLSASLTKPELETAAPVTDLDGSTFVASAIKQAKPRSSATHSNIPPTRWKRRSTHACPGRSINPLVGWVYILGAFDLDDMAMLGQDPGVDRN
jgi:hypothetical protein